jgi:hypothetical protein
MRLNKIATYVAEGFVLATGQFVSAFYSPVLAWIVAAAIGFWAFRLFEFLSGEPGLWAPWIGAALASLIGVLPGLLGGKGWLLAASPAIAFSTAGFKVLLDRRSSRRCSLCLRRLGKSVFFTCPRCGLLVCDEGCWDFDRCRCRLCVQNKVPAILGHDNRWWDKQFGGRVTAGRCPLCLTAAPESDLRGCPKCGRAQCRACWDEVNGQCMHCGWILPDLPPELRMYLIPARNAGAG